MALPPQRSNSAPDLRVLLSGPVNTIPPAVVARGPMESSTMAGALVPFKAPEVSCPKTHSHPAHTAYCAVEHTGCCAQTALPHLGVMSTGFLLKSASDCRGGICFKGEGEAGVHLVAGYALSWCRLLFTREAPAYTTGAFLLSLISECSPLLELRLAV